MILIITLKNSFSGYLQTGLQCNQSWRLQRLVRRSKKSGFDVRVLLAFAAIYVLWGSTYLAIRIAVQQVPPLFAAGVRFFLAGTLLYAVMRFAGARGPRAKSGAVWW